MTSSGTDLSDTMVALASAKKVLFAQEQDLPWLPLRELPGFDGTDIEGVFGKLFGDPESGPWFYLIRHDPGTVVESHTHDGNVIHYLLQGEWRMGSRHAGPGWFHYEKKGIHYGPIISGDQGSLFFAIYDHAPRFKAKEK